VKEGCQPVIRSPVSCNDGVWKVDDVSTGEESDSSVVVGDDGAGSCDTVILKGRFRQLGAHENAGNILRRHGIIERKHVVL